jgi:DNA-binding transcriptional ArsR family regulator
MNDIVQLMNTSSRSAVALLPLFRSEAQYRLVGELFTEPGREVSVGDLAQRIHASHATVSREVGRLEAAGLLRSRDEGRRRLVTADTNTPIFEPLRDLMSKVYGVPAVIREEFGHLEARVLIFGSWAARWSGRAGKTPNDVDVLVIGDVDPTAAWDAAARATNRLGIEVNVVVRDQREWDDDRSGFATDVAEQPLIEISDHPHVAEPEADG